MENSSVYSLSFVKKAVELHAHRLLDGQNGRTIFKLPSQTNLLRLQKVIDLLQVSAHFVLSMQITVLFKRKLKPSTLVEETP